MNSILRRRRALMGAKGSGGLPSEYQEVEWIGYSQKNALLNTSVACDNVTYIKSVIKKDSIPSSGTVFPRVTNNYWGTLENISGSKFSASPSYAKDVTFDFTEITSTKTGGSVTGDIYIGYGAAGYVPVLRYKTLKIYGASDNLLFDGIPCYKKSGTVIGMYDLVSQSFIGGTGIWEKGADV